MTRDISLRVHTGEQNFVEGADPVAEDLFGAEFLGHRFFSDFDTRFRDLDLGHMRWPGGDPVEIGVDTDGDGERNTVFDLTFENYVDWDRNDGTPREGIREIFSYTSENAVSLSMVIPTSKYVRMIIEEGRETGLEAARKEVGDFARSIYDGTFGPPPDALTIEIGSEYYNTDVWRDHIGDKTVDVTAALGDVFAMMSRELGDIRASFGPDAATDLEIAVQIGRIGRNRDGVSGGFEDNETFIDAFREFDAIDSLDALIYHRYVPNFWGIERGLSDDLGGISLEEAVGIWNDASGRNLDLTAGYMSPTVNSNGDIEHGAVGLTNLLQFAAHLVEAGVDEGTAFGLGSGSSGTLGFRSDILINGQLLGMMNESLPGMNLIGGYLDNVSPVETRFENGRIISETIPESDHVNSYLFEDSEQFVGFFSAKKFQAEGVDSLSYDIVLDGDFSNGSLTRLTPGEDYSFNGEYLGQKGVVSREDIVMTRLEDGTMSINVEFGQDFEILRLTLEKEDPGAAIPSIPDTLEEALIFTPDEGDEIIFNHEEGGSQDLSILSDMTGWLDLAPGAFDAGSVGVSDALDILRISVGLEPSFGPATPQDLIAADVNRSGDITSADALDVLRMAVGLDAEGPGDMFLVDGNALPDEIDGGRETFTPGIRFDEALRMEDLDFQIITLGDLSSINDF